PGFLGSTRYEVLDNRDMLIGIADWESAEARAAHMQECGHRRLHTSGGDVGCTVQGNGHQAAALTGGEVILGGAIPHRGRLSTGSMASAVGEVPWVGSRHGLTPAGRGERFDHAGGIE